MDEEKPSILKQLQDALLAGNRSFVNRTLRRYNIRIQQQADFSRAELLDRETGEPVLEVQSSSMFSPTGRINPVLNRDLKFNNGYGPSRLDDVLHTVMYQTMLVRAQETIALERVRNLSRQPVTAEPLSAAQQAMLQRLRRLRRDEA